MARQYWIAGDFADQRRAGRVIRICGKATEMDPGYAQAWALMGLAQAHVYYGIVADQGGDDGSAAAERALALDPGIAESRLPKAWRLSALGRTAEANEEIATALRLDGDSWEVNKEAARLLYRQGRIEEATRHLERATELMEADFHGWGMLLACYTARQNTGGARRCAAKIIEQVEKVLDRDPNNGVALALGALSFAAAGRLDHARQWTERAMLLDPDNLFMRYNLGWSLFALHDDRDAAIDMLEPVLARGGTQTIILAANDPNLQKLRGNSRFEQLLASAMTRVDLQPSGATRRN